MKDSCLPRQRKAKKEQRSMGDEPLILQRMTVKNIKSGGGAFTFNKTSFLKTSINNTLAIQFDGYAQ